MMNNVLTLPDAPVFMSIVDGSRGEFYFIAGYDRTIHVHTPGDSPSVLTSDTSYDIDHVLKFKAVY